METRDPFTVVALPHSLGGASLCGLRRRQNGEWRGGVESILALAFSHVVLCATALAFRDCRFPVFNFTDGARTERRHGDRPLLALSSSSKTSRQD